MINSDVCIVTGGLGFIGKNFCLSHSLKYKKRIIIDKITAVSDLQFYENNLKNSGWELYTRDIRNIRTVLDQISGMSTTIFNFAAESHVDKSFTNAPDFIDSNVLSTSYMLEAIKTAKMPVRLVHISTDEVYGEMTQEKAKERQAFNPTNPYAASKAAADILVQTYSKCFSLDTAIIRANNIYGPYQYIEKVIPKAIQRAKEKKSFILHGGGVQQRHFLHTRDFTRAVELILQNWNNTDLEKRRIFNIAGDDEWRILDLVNYIYEKSGTDRSLVSRSKNDRPFNDQRYMINDTYLRSLGWEPKEKFSEQIEIMINGEMYLT